MIQILQVFPHKYSILIFLLHRLDERKKIHDAIQEDDQKKMGITRNLEKQLQEKEEKIKGYEARLAELEANSGAM